MKNNLKPPANNRCALTVDVEDYFHVAAFEQNIEVSDWGNKYPLRVETNTERLLEIFAENQVKATFFMLGWVAERCPLLCRKIVENGHELASHGYWHQKASSQSLLDFKNDVYRSKATLEDLTGIEILGYRAPSFSINTTNEWAFAVLSELGFVYSSSTYPIKHDHYGTPDWPKHLHYRPEGIIEIPIPTLQILGKEIPIGGGGFFRLYPYLLSQGLIKKYLKETGMPYSFYFHPWEIDSEQPKVTNIPFKSQFRHYLNLKCMEGRICNLLANFSWNTMKKTYQINGIKNVKTNTNKNNAKKRHSILG